MLHTCWKDSVIYQCHTCSTEWLALLPGIQSFRRLKRAPTLGIRRRWTRSDSIDGAVIVMVTLNLPQSPEANEWWFGNGDWWSQRQIPDPWFQIMGLRSQVLHGCENNYRPVLWWEVDTDSKFSARFSRCFWTLLHCFTAPLLHACSAMILVFINIVMRMRPLGQYLLSLLQAIWREETPSQLHCGLFSFVYLPRTDCVRWEFAWERLNRKIMSLN